MEDRNAMIAQIKALKELQRRRAKRPFHDFLQYVNPKYENEFYSKLKAAKYHLLRNTKMNWGRWWRYNDKMRLREIWECVYVRCWGVFFVKGGEK